MTWKTTLYLSLIVATAITTILVVQFILANLWIVGLLFSPVIVTTTYFLVFRVKNEYERLLLSRAERKACEYRGRVIDTDKGTWFIQHQLPDGSVDIASLHNNPQWQINGHREPVTQAELFAWSTYNRRGDASKGITQLQSGMAQLPAPQLDLLLLLDRAERVLVKGASDAGKTTLLQHIASRSNGIMIIDPHFAPGIWPVSDKRVVGAGRNYVAIDKFLNQLMAELDSRYQQRARGKTDFAQITLIIDEYQSVRAECQDAGKILSTLIRESRKVGFRLFIGSHSELVKPLGLEGQGDVRDGLLIVRLEIDQTSKQRRIMIDRGNGQEDCYIPPFNSTEPILPDLILQPTKEASHLIELIQAGITSRKQLSESIWGRGKYGKFYNDKIDAILAKYELEVELG